MGAFIKANRTFFLLLFLILLAVFGYFWYRSGFTLEFSKFFASAPVPAGGPGIVINNAPVSHGQQVSISWSKLDADECHALNWIDTGGLIEGTALSAPVDACSASSGTVTIVCSYASSGGVTGQTSKTFAINSASCPSATVSPTPTATGGGGGAPNVCAGALESHTDSQTHVTFCIKSTNFNTATCTNSTGQTLTQVVGVMNNSSFNGYFRSAGFGDPIAGCSATQTGTFGFGPTGDTTIPAGQSGVVTFSYNAASIACGRVQLDSCFFGDGFGCMDTDQWNILGKVINSGTSCSTPAPTPTPTATVTLSPTPTLTVSTTPTATTTPLLSCNPTGQTVSVGQSATINATGGSGSGFTWFAPGGSPATAAGTPFSVTYNTPGFKTVTVASGGQQAACTVTVTSPIQSVSPPVSPSLPPLACSPATQTVLIGQSTSFQATGGIGINGQTYTWSAPGGSPTSGTGSAFSPSYQTVGTKIVTLTDALGASTTCTVTVVGPGASISTAPNVARITIQKLVRNITQNGIEADNVNANPGDTVEFVLRVSSVGSATATHVIVADGPPAGLIFQPGTTTIDGVRSADITPNSDASALVLGDMAPGRTIIVRFRATVAPASFFASGTTVLTNTGFARGDNTDSVRDTAFVTVVNVPANLTLTLTKLGRNITRGETTEHTPVLSSPGQTIEFVLRVRNTSAAAVTNVMLRDIVPVGITPIAGSVRIGGVAAPDALTAAGLSLGTLAPGQEVVVTFRGIVASASQLPVGTTTLINTAVVTATGVSPLTAQLPIIISTTVIVPPVNTGPGESTVLALIISGIITLLYVGYTSTDTYRRHEIGELVKEAKDDQFNFRR